MGSRKEFALHLVKDVELVADLFKDGSFSSKSFKADELNVDKNGNVEEGTMETILYAVQQVKSQQRRQGSAIDITYSSKRQRDGYGDAMKLTLSVKVSDYFRQLNFNGKLPDPFIRIDGTINATEGCTIILNDKINVRISWDDLSAGRLYEIYDYESALNQIVSPPVQMKLKISILLGWKKQLITSVKLDEFSIVRKMYANEFTKDYTLVASNGVKVKCHGFILAAHSPVLEKMINPSNGMKESQSKVIEAEDISENGLIWLLQYLYGLEVSVDDTGCELISELFQAAHYYELEHLEKSLEKIFLQNDETWYTPDSILELYFFVKLLDQFKALREHLLQIMTRMTLGIRKCERMKTLKKNDMADFLWKLVDVSNNIKSEDM